MSKKYPERPLYNHDSCKELHNPKLCAIVREDATCLRELPKNITKSKPSRIFGKYSGGIVEESKSATGAFVQKVLKV